MMKVLKHGMVYAPEKIGIRDILIADERIVRVAEHIDEYDKAPDVEVFDLTGKIVVPGFIDLHEHITGGGGELGPASRCPEMQLSELVRTGITTVLGLLGTDGTTRSVENLLAKCQAFNDEGITCFMLTGSYGMDSTTLTGSVERDVMLLRECVGVKIAVSDHRSDNPSRKDLSRAVMAARRGGLLGGKAGITVMHMGSGKAVMAPIFKMLDKSDIPIRNLLPTHMGRNEELLKQGMEFVKMGGTIDLTCGDTPEKLHKSAEKLARLYRECADFGLVTTSTDSHGSMPKFDAEGNCIGLTYASPLNLHRQTMMMVQEFGMPLEDALRVTTTNAARVLTLEGKKGCIAAGADADIQAWDQDLVLTDLFCRGKLAMRDKEVIMKGKFED